MDAVRNDRSADRELALPFTITGILAIVLLGLVVVPLSIPDPLPEPDPARVLGERYLVAFSEPGSPTAAVKARIPTMDHVTKTYGTDGGTACTGSLAEAYALARSGRSVDPAALASIKVAHSIYCPDRTAKFTTFVKRRAALNASARTARPA